MKLWQRNALLLAAAVTLAALPLVFLRDAEWLGADDRGMAAIQQLNADYRPWFGHLFDPSALGIERYLFGLQALLGASVTFGAIGWFVARRASTDLKVPVATAGVGLVLLGLLFLPNPKAQELQDLLSALQGVCLGFLAYFVGYVAGRRGQPVPD